MNNQPENIEKIKKLVDQLRLQYADDSNVRSIGWGLKRKKGSYQDTLSIIFYVRKKMPSTRLIEQMKSQLIPDTIEEIPTDVEEVAPGFDAAGQRDEQEYDPLIGGVASSNADGHIYWFNGHGTLGMLVRDSTTNAPMALSNWHVWAEGGEAGDDIIQPGHPTAGDHVEAVTKIAACGPLITSLLEWEVPSPLTAGLYGGAAAAGIAAAASDYRDPTRRGQDQTTVNSGEKTTGEKVEMQIEYQQLPLPGTPFQTDVKWQYERYTTNGMHTYAVEESKVNTQFLIAKMVVTNKTSYQPGERVQLTAAIWDYQPRPCDGYHVVAHLIPHTRPTTALRVLLHPTVCPRTFPQQPPKGDKEEEICISFDKWNKGQYPYQGQFDWLRYRNTSLEPVRVVDWFNPYQALQISQRPLLLSHAPASQVKAQVAQFTNTPINLLAYNAAGVLVDQQAAPNVQGVVHELALKGDGIVRVVVRGGGGEGLLIKYCILQASGEELSIKSTTALAAAIQREAPKVKIHNKKLKARRCCFTGGLQLPPDEQPGKWDVYLTVQNVNQVPEGTPPEEAATTIGGHLLSAHASADVVACTAVMLLDHVFDVF